MEKSWLDSILTAAGGAYDQYQTNKTTAAAQKLAAKQASTASALPSWLIPSAVVVFVLLLVGVVMTRK